MDELIAFVRRCVDEDERAAREVAERAPHDEWDATGARGEDDVARSHAEVVGITRPHATPAARSIAEHIARWDPARVLAEVKAKRAILDEHPHEPAAPWGTTEVTSIGCATCHDRSEGVIGKGWCRTVRLLAQPFAGYDGWREEWRISAAP